MSAFIEEAKQRQGKPGNQVRPKKQQQLLKKQQGYWSQIYNMVGNQLHTELTSPHNSYMKNHLVSCMAL